MRRCDVLIVGGGPAGSSCAGKLLDAGVDVLLIDKKPFPRDKTCAGWVTPPVLKSLGFDADDYRNGRVFQPITGFRTGIISGEEVVSRYDEVVSYGIRRFEFDHYLLARTRVECLLGEPVKAIEKNGTGWIVNGSIRASLIVGAGGHFCPVARMMGNRKNRVESVVTAQEIEFEPPLDLLDTGSVEAETPEFFFCDDLKGYGWCVRKDNFLNIGLGRVDADALSSHVAAFCGFLKEQGKVRCEIPARFHGHAYELYEQSEPKLVDDGVLLVGDSAGLAYPQSGEGIRPAVESGLIAGDVICSAKGDYSRARLEEYRLQLTHRLGRPRKHRAGNWLPAGWLRFAATRLLATRWFSKRVVLNRWFLHADEAAL